MMYGTTAVLLGIALVLVNLQVILTFLGKKDQRLNPIETKEVHESDYCPVCGEPGVDDAVQVGDDKVCPACKESYVERFILDVDDDSMA